MPSIQRPLGGDVLFFDLRDEHDRTPVADPPGRSARTLVKDGSMRVTLIRLAPGGSIAEHGARYDIRSGRVRALPAVRPLRTHEVRVDEAGRILVKFEA